METKMKFSIGLCFIFSTIALGIFIPWFWIMKSISDFEVFAVIACLILIGYLILFIAPYFFITAQILSICTYLYILFKYKANKTNKTYITWLIIITLMVLPNIILFKDVSSIYHAAFTFDWWGNADYFKFPF